MTTSALPSPETRGGTPPEPRADARALVRSMRAELLSVKSSVSQVQSILEEAVSALSQGFNELCQENLRQRELTDALLSLFQPDPEEVEALTQRFAAEAATDSSDVVEAKAKVLEMLDGGSRREGRISDGWQRSVSASAESGEAVSISVTGLQFEDMTFQLLGHVRQRIESIEELSMMSASLLPVKR